MRQNDIHLLEASGACAMRYRYREGSLQWCIEGVLDTGRNRLCSALETFPWHVLVAVSLLSSYTAIVTWTRRSLHSLLRALCSKGRRLGRAWLCFKYGSRGV
jgi:hypothetical protein